MTEVEGGIIVGVLGQWASGKTVAAKTLVRHLSGKDKVVFLTDRVLIASQVANMIMTKLKDSEQTSSLHSKRCLEACDRQKRLMPSESTGRYCKRVSLLAVQA